MHEKKKGREGRKWIYYKLSWKGESLLHPENTKIVVLFTITFIALWAGIIQMAWYIKGKVMGVGSDFYYYAQKGGEGTPLAEDGIETVPENSRLFLNVSNGETSILYQDPVFLYIAIICFIVFIIILCVSPWKLRENRSPKL